jgi:hypothetical protein
MRLKSQPKICANPFASVVLATPGTPSKQDVTAAEQPNQQPLRQPRIADEDLPDLFHHGLTQLGGLHQALGMYCVCFHRLSLPQLLSVPWLGWSSSANSSVAHLYHSASFRSEIWVRSSCPGLLGDWPSRSERSPFHSFHPALPPAD